MKLKLDFIDLYYEPSTHSLYNIGGELLNYPPLYEDEFYSNEFSKNNTRSKSDSPKALRIVLGHKCNYSCSYCLQQDLSTETTELNKNIFTNSFIRNIKALNLSKLTRIELWGGEPFLYWNDMKHIISELDNENITFFISTNGSAFKQKHIDFFKTIQGKINIGISHDGPGHEKLRGKNIFETPEVVNMIKQLDSMDNVRYSFNVVISDGNYKFLEIDEYFQRYSQMMNLKNPSLSFILCYAYEEKSCSSISYDHVISNENLYDFRNEIQKYLGADEYVLLKSNMLTDVKKLALSFKYQTPVTSSSNCGADSEDILSVDLNGRVRTCPQTGEDHICGTITNIKDVHVDKIELDRDTKHGCSTCFVQRICKSVCPIKLSDRAFEQNCKSSKIWYGEQFQKSIRLVLGVDIV